MSESGEKLSLIDLIEYYEPGPVLKERTPDLNRTSFYPDEAQHFESDEAPEPGKNITRKAELDLIRKKALGLTDVPIHSTPGNSGAFRKRDEYNEEDFESQFTTGFGGPSELNNFLDIEDKPPTNITRKLKVKSNPDKKEELDKMSFETRELLKLAKALRHRGQDSFAHRVEAVALRKVASTLSDQQKVNLMKYWRENELWSRLGEAQGKASEAFVNSTYAGPYNSVQTGTDEDLMLLACFYGPNLAEVKKLFKKQDESAWVRPAQGTTFGYGKPYAEAANLMEIVKAEHSDEEFQAWCNAMLNRDVSDKNFSPTEGKFRAAPKAAPAGGGKAPSAGEGTARDDRSTTQQRTWKDVQVKLNELYTGDGALASKVRDGKIKDTNVEIRLAEDADRWKDQTGLGPQTTGAFNVATGAGYEPKKWPVDPDQAYAMLEDVGKKEEDKDTKKDDPEKEGSEEEVDKGAILRGARLNSVGSLDEWYTAPADDGKTLVAIRKSDGQLAAMSQMKFDVVKNEDGGHTLTQSEDGQQVWTDIENRGEKNQILFASGDDYLSVGEQTRLMREIRDAGLDKEIEKTYKDVIVGQRRGERGGFLNLKGVKRRGKLREDAARGRLRGRNK